MTYVAGILSNKTCVLICDSRVSFDATTLDNNYALKSGHLFPGCIYAGTCNDTNVMRDFIRRLKTLLTGRRTPTEFWGIFVRYFETYGGLKPDQHFQLLISSRHTGEPRLYIADSLLSSVVEQQTDVVSLGSGKQYLDPVLHKTLLDRHRSILDQIKRDKAPEWFWGYWYCLALTECAQGDLAYELNKIGVGGIFHFGYQNCAEEKRQHPAVYDIVSIFPTKHQINHYIYRATFEQMALVVENPAENVHAVCIDGAVWPKIDELNQVDRGALMEAIFQGANAQPFYYFFGLGFSDDRHRGKWLSHLNLGNNQFVVTRGKIDHPFITQYVESVVSAMPDSPLSHS